MKVRVNKGLIENDFQSTVYIYTHALDSSLLYNTMHSFHMHNTL